MGLLLDAQPVELECGFSKTALLNPPHSRAVASNI